MGRSSGYLENCVNSGSIKGRKDVGGVAGQIAPNIRLIFSPDTINDACDTLAAPLDRLEEIADNGEDILDTMADGMDLLEDSLEQMSDAMEGFRDAVRLAQEGLDNFQQALRDLSRALVVGDPGAIDQALRLLRDGALDLSEAPEDCGEAVEELHQLLEEGSPDDEELSNYLSACLYLLKDGFEALRPRQP